MRDDSLPPPLMTSEPGSFAEYTICQRKPQIIAGVRADNAYPPEVCRALDALAAEIADGPVQPLHEDGADVAFWRSAWAPWEGRSWRALPWFFAETYFYRRLLEAVRYFQPGPWRLADPFAVQKRQALAEGLPSLATFLRGTAGLAGEDLFRAWLHRCLWGNRADLSNVVVSESGHREEADDILVDDVADAWAHLRGRRAPRVDWVADNAGLELLCDLGAMDMLLRHGLAGGVRVHLKGQPYFVSDAMPKDLEASVAALAACDDEDLRALGERLSRYLRQGRLAVRTHSFWATCLAYGQLPEDLRDELGGADLLILKGDVNYRRLLEDRHWPPATPLEEIAGYMPASFLTLRTLKAELIAGLPEGMAESVAREDPAWLANGKRGVIQLVKHER